MPVDFTWDPQKAASNLEKHGVAFEDAVRVFADENLVSELEGHVGGQERWQTIGIVDGQLMLLVVHTDWSEDDVDIIRIISARKAERHERWKYQGQFGPLRH